MKRTTQQRKVILEILSAHVDHPTAEELYDEIRETLPSISMGTVYRNLDLLSRKGEITRIPGGTGPSRFDPVHEGHPHLRCTGCNRVFDLPEECSLGKLINRSLLKKHGILIEGIQLEILSYCSDCRNERDERNQGFS